MNRIAGVLVIAVALAWSGAAPAQGPYGTLVVRNQTDATMELSRDGDKVVIKVPPDMVLVLEGYLSQGRHEVQVEAPCVTGTQPFTESFWVSGEAAKSNVLVINPDNFGKSLMFDKPDCGVKPEGAATFGRCLEYAQKSVHQANMAHDMKCPSSEELWDRDLTNHLVWCLSASSVEARAKVEARAEALADCEAKQDKRPWCEEYAVEASTRTTVAGVHGCGFSGDLWNKDPGVHYDYCMAVGREEAQQAMDSRDKAIEDCLAEVKSDLFCRDYAAKVLEMRQTGVDMQCALADADWSEDSNKHYDHCLQAGEEHAEQNLAARQAELDQCRERKEREKAQAQAEEEARQQAQAQAQAEEQARQDALDDRCVDYADRAVTQFEESESLGCGYGGGRWSDDYDGHYHWCLGASQAATDNEDKARVDDLEACRAKMSRKGFCDRYAGTAVDQFHQSRGMGCNFGGSRWSDDRDGHYNWCMGVSDQQAEGETTAREQGLIQCSERDN